MPTRKQRRRRAKGRRHEYEYVYVDEEGREVEVDEPDEPAAGKKPDRAEPRSRTATRGGRQGRKIEPPSWRRVFRRGAIFAPLMLVVIYLLQKEKNVGAAVTQAAVLMAFFLPFSYLMDSIMYRSYRKRSGDDGGSGAKRR